MKLDEKIVAATDAQAEAGMIAEIDPLQDLSPELVGSVVPHGCEADRFGTHADDRSIASLQADCWSCQDNVAGFEDRPA